MRFLLLLCGLVSGAMASVPWEPTGKRDGVEMYRREFPDSDIIELKGIGVIEQPLWKVASSLLDTERAPEWVDSLEQSNVVRRIDIRTYVEYNHIGTPFFMRDRDFVSLVKILIDPKEKTFALHYSPSEEEVADTGNIRGIIDPGSFQLKAIDRNRTLLTGEIHCDPKGSIAKWLVNFFQSDWAHDTIMALRTQTAKKDHRIPAEFKDVLEPTLSF